MRRTDPLLALSLTTAALAGSMSAETITVCAKGCDHTSINAAITVASDGDVIQLAAETYREGSPEKPITGGDRTHQPRPRGRARRARFADLPGIPLGLHSAA